MAAERRDLHAAIAGLGRLAGVFQRRREQLAESVGLTEREWRVLDEIATAGFMPSLFARSSESTPAAVSKVLRQLLDRELVAVNVASGDRRQREYQLTSKGKKLLARLDGGRRHAIREVWSALDGAELKRFTAFATGLAERLEEYSARVEKKE